MKSFYMDEEIRKFIRKIEQNYYYFSDNELEKIIEKISTQKQRNLFYLLILHSYYQWNDDYVFAFKGMGERVKNILDKIETSVLNEYQLYWYCFFSINRLLILEEEFETVFEIYEKFEDKFNKYKLLFELEKASILTRFQNTAEEGMELLNKLAIKIEKSDISKFRKGFYYYRLAQKFHTSLIIDSNSTYQYFEKALNFIKEQPSPMCDSLLIDISGRMADIEYLNNNNYKEALKIYRGVLNKYSKIIRKYYFIHRIGQIYIGMERYEDALKYLEKSMAIYPQNEYFNKLYLILEIGSCHVNKNDMDDEDVKIAIDILENNKHFFRKHPFFYFYLKTLGFYYQLIKDYDKAIKYYKDTLKVLKTEDKYDNEIIISTFADLAFCLIELKQHKEAENILKEFFSQNNEDTVLLILPLIEYAEISYLTNQVILSLRIIKRIKRYYKNLKKEFSIDEPTYKNLDVRKYRIKLLLKGIAKYYGLFYILLYPFLPPIKLDELK